MPNNNKKIKILEGKTWEDERFIIQSDAIKTGRTEGVATRTLKKYEGKAPMARKSFFIHKDQNVAEILGWLVNTISSYFRKYWNRDVTLQQLEKSQKEVDVLKNELIKRGGEHEELKRKFSEQEKDLKLAQEVIKNAQNYKTKLDEFEKKIEESVINKKNIEEWVKEEIKNNRWLLGLDCEVKAKNKNIDIETEVDIHVETNFGEQRIIEAKSPNLRVFYSKSKKGGRLNISKEVSVALSEIIEYMRRTDVNSGLRTKGVYGIQKPIGRVLVGYELTSQEKEVLNDWNFYLAPYIKIVTYKELINSARKEINLIKAAEVQFLKNV